MPCQSSTIQTGDWQPASVSSFSPRPSNSSSLSSSIVSAMTSSSHASAEGDATRSDFHYPALFNLFPKSEDFGHIRDLVDGRARRENRQCFCDDFCRHAYDCPVGFHGRNQLGASPGCTWYDGLRWWELSILLRQSPLGVFGCILVGKSGPCV